MLHRLRRTSSLVALLTCVLVAGCSSSSVTTGSITTDGPAASSTNFFEMSDLELQAATQRWSEAYKKRPNDATSAMTYANALRASGRHPEAVAVLERLVQNSQDDPQLLLAYSKALTGVGRFDQALLAVKKSQASGTIHWEHYSVEGAILDQLGRSSEARERYNQALALSPNNATILNNLGTSYLLSGDLNSAERTLRVAVNQPNSGQRPRQNLALVLALQGKFEESERIAAEDMTPQQAEQNVNYVKSMLRQTDTWSKIKNSG